MKVLLTNGSGFVGGHLIEALDEGRHEIHAWHIDPISDQHRRMPVQWARQDITDQATLAGRIQALKPDCVIHLAAISDVPAALKAPVMSWQVNVIGTLILLDALATHSSRSRLLYIGSGDAYGDSFNQQPQIDESAPLQPQNPYSASKAAAEVAVREFARRGALPTLCVRPFNHIGPGQSDRFAIPSFAAQIAAIEAREFEPLMRVGNLSAIRDFTDVRDVVRAYTLLMHEPESRYDGSAVNVCSGQARSMQSMLDGLLALSDVRIEVTTDPQRLRPSDTPRIVGRHDRLSRWCGWQPQMAIEQSLADILDEARSLKPSLRQG